MKRKIQILKTGQIIAIIGLCLSGITLNAQSDTAFLAGDVGSAWVNAVKFKGAGILYYAEGKVEGDAVGTYLNLKGTWVNNVVNDPDIGKTYPKIGFAATYPGQTAAGWPANVSNELPDVWFQYFKIKSPWVAMPINQQTASDAYTSVLDNVGATLPKRDAVDTHVVHDALNGDATYEGPTYETIKTVKDKSKNCGIIDLPDNVGGWPVLNSTTAPTDTDHDGMPDDWETAHQLNPNDSADGNLEAANGYTNLENYLNGIEFNYQVGGYSLTKLSANSYLLGRSDNYLAETGFIVERSDNNGPFTKIVPWKCHIYEECRATPLIQDIG